MTFRKAALSIGAVFLASIILALTGIAFRYEYVDVPLHFLGGFTWTMVAAILIQKAGKQSGPKWFNFIFTVGFVLVIGVAWEWAEYIEVQLIDSQALTEGFTLRDMLGDFILDSLGAIVGWYFFVKNIK